MKNYSQEELQNALKVVSSTISRCEKIQPKFKEGTSQFSLLCILQEQFLQLVQSKS
ncbi:MAG: hypothetical protein KHY44_15010 [Clostridiales bacterium]|nr:hypothetical protein [Clostridiales bacterium]